jgi:hypothetical protein
MILKLRIGHIRITFTIATVIDVLGVNSKLPDGNHILMWDFDKTPLNIVENALITIAYRYDLPRIYILETSKPNNYIAYCFKRCSWQEARSIVGCTIGIDEAFYKWAVFRKRFTLRVGAKAGVMPHLVSTIAGSCREEVAIEELKSWVKYETLDSHHTQNVHFIEVP